MTADGADKAPRVSSNREFKRIEKDFSQDWEIYTVVTSKLRLATLHDLQTVYTCEDLYDMLEIIDVNTSIQEEQYKEQEKKLQQKK